MNIDSFKSPSTVLLRRSLIAALAIALTGVAGGCGKKTDDTNTPRATMITVAPAQAQDLEVLQETVGQADSDAAPFVAAEVAGRIIQIAADTGQRVTAGQVLAVLDAQDQGTARQTTAAEVKRVQAQLANQERLVERYRTLLKENFISQTALENAESQLDVLREQLAAAQAQQETAERNLTRTRVTAPIAGRIEQRLVAVGDFVTIGKPLFQLTSTRSLRIRLPFPEAAASQLRAGLPVRLSTPTAPDKTVQGRLSELRPMVSGSRALEAIVDVPNPGDWRPGASVQGAVVVGTRLQAVVVPEVSVVLRPAGEVVYVIQNGQAQQRIVHSGLRQNGLVEILSGLAAGEIVAVDGASFLTDKAPVATQEHRPAAAGGA